MKIEKVSQTNLKRSILKPLKYRREEAVFDVSIEEMCYGINCKDDEVLLMSESVLYGNEKDLGIFSVAQVMNDLATRGGQLVGVSVHIMLPPYAYDSRLKSMMEYIERVCSLHDVQVLCAKAEVSPAVTMAIIHMTGVGITKKETLHSKSTAKPNQDIVLLGWIGLEGTLRALREKEAELSERFVPTFLNKIYSLEEELFVADAIRLAKECGASSMKQITGGGILATLWEMADASKVGLEVELKKMSIRQETVEICEFCHLNPYQLTSVGSVLIFTDDGEALIEAYKEKGIQASLLGRTTEDIARIILGGE